jgi:allantoinase
MTEIQKARAAYSPIINRRPLKLPGGARLGVWFIVTVEKWDIDATMARTVLPAPQGISVTPDIPNYSWFDYGLRVGFWRLKKVLDMHPFVKAIPLSLKKVCAAAGKYWPTAMNNAP